MRGFSENHDFPEIPFIATRGYDSVVWNRLYSRDPADTDYWSRQASNFSAVTKLKKNKKRKMSVASKRDLIYFK